MKTFEDYEIENLVKHLKKALKQNQYEKANFDKLNDPIPKGLTEVTSLIKERTKLYRRTWIDLPIIEALKILEPHYPRADGYYWLIQENKPNTIVRVSEKSFTFNGNSASFSVKSYYEEGGDRFYGPIPPYDLINYRK